MRRNIRILATQPRPLVGDLKDKNNSAATQIFNNINTGNLQCWGNVAAPLNSITGGSNTAKQKQGQAHVFDDQSSTAQSR